MIELYTHPMSPCAQKVRMLLATKGLDWEARHVDLPNKANLDPAYLALNPLGVVPTLVHDGQVVIESSIICEYLEDSFPEPPQRPLDPHARAQMRFWMKHVDNKLHPACGTLQWPMVMRPGLMAKSEQERQALLDKIPEKPRRERQKRLVAQGLDAPDVADAVRVYRKTIEDMETALNNTTWLVSDDLSLADLCVAPYFQTLYQFSWQALFSDCPRVAAWYSAMRDRPEYQSGVSADFPAETLEQLQAAGSAVWHKLAAHL